MLDAARDELHAIRRYLTPRHVSWRSFWHRDERGILRPYWRLRHRQAFHDGVCAALLVVAVRRALIDQEQDGSALARRPEEDTGPGPARRPPRARTIIRIAAAVTGRQFGYRGGL